VRTVLAAARSAAWVGSAIDDAATKVSTPAAALSVNLRINIGWFSLHSGRRDAAGGREGAPLRQSQLVSKVAAANATACVIAFFGRNSKVASYSKNVTYRNVPGCRPQRMSMGSY